MAVLRNLRNAESHRWLLILICNTLISLLSARNAAAITAAPVTAATDAIAATNYRNTRNYEQAAAAMTAALTAAAVLPLASTTTKASTKDYAQQLPRYREVGASVPSVNSAAMPIYRNYFENSDVNSDKIDATSVDLRDQMVQWRTPHAGGGRTPEALPDESAAIAAAGFVPKTMTAAGQHYVDSMNADEATVTALGSVRVGAEFSANVDADGNSFGGSFAYATPSGKIDYEFKEDNYESADTGESGGNAASEGRGKSLSTVADVDGVYKYDMGEYAGFSAHIGNDGEDARYGKAPIGVATANQGGGAGASYYENHLPNYENYFMPTYQIEQFSNYHNQATESAQAEEQAQSEGQALEVEQRKAVQQKASMPHGHAEQPQLRPMTLLNGGDGVGDDDNNAAMLQQFNKGVNIENYANDRQKLRYYVKQPHMQKEQHQQQQQQHQQQQQDQNVQKLQQQQQQRSTQSQNIFQQQQNLQQQHHDLQQQLNVHQQDNLQPQLRLQQKHFQQQLNLQQQNLQELQQNSRQQQQQQQHQQRNSQQQYQLLQQKHKQQLLLPHHFRKLPEFLHYSLPQRWPRPQTRQVKTLSKATRPNYQDALSTRRRRQQKRDATSLQVIGSSDAARTRYSLLPTMRNFHTLDSDNAGDTISSSSPSSPGSRSGGYKRSISEIFADDANAPTQYSYVRVYPSPHVSHLIDDSVNEIDDTHNNIDDSNGRQQQSGRNGNSGDEEKHDDGNISHRDVQQNFIQTLSQPTVKSYQLHNGAHTLPPITTSVRHTPASSAALAGIPLARHVEVTKHIAAVDYERIHVPYNQSVPIRIPQPIITAVPRPYAIRVPVSRTIAVPKVQEVRIPIEKVKPFPVERPVPFVVERRVPYMVEKQVAKPVYYPYPVKVPIVKTIVHKVTRRPHTYATYQAHASSYPISLGQYHLQQPHLGSHTLPSSVQYTHSTEHLG